jgi:hypothetical protein
VQQYRCNGAVMILQTEEKISPAMVQSWLIFDGWNYIINK